MIFGRRRKRIFERKRVREAGLMYAVENLSPGTARFFLHQLACLADPAEQRRLWLGGGYESSSPWEDYERYFDYFDIFLRASEVRDRAALADALKRVEDALNAVPRPLMARPEQLLQADCWRAVQAAAAEALALAEPEFGPLASQQEQTEEAGVNAEAVVVNGNVDPKTD